MTYMQNLKLQIFQNFFWPWVGEKFLRYDIENIRHKGKNNKLDFKVEFFYSLKTLSG